MCFNEAESLLPTLQIKQILAANKSLGAKTVITVQYTMPHLKLFSSQGCQDTWCCAVKLSCCSHSLRRGTCPTCHTGPPQSDRSDAQNKSDSFLRWEHKSTRYPSSALLTFFTISANTAVSLVLMCKQY